jgi:membrane protein required for colicin V production
MNYLDIFLCIPLAWGLYKGFMKGLVLELITLFSLLGAIWVAVNFSDYITHFVQLKFSWKSPYLPVISFVTLFIAVLAGVYGVGKLLERSVDAADLGPVNKVAGALFGVFKFALIMSVVIFMIDAVGKSYTVFSSEKKTESLLYKPLALIAPAVIPGLKGSRVGGMLKEKKEAGSQ